MSKKPFVSIAFFQKKVQVLLLNSEKNSVDKFATADLPSNLIVNYQVQNKEALASILKKLWTQYGFSEKSVGLVVPEFSTFTKLLRLPKLNLSDLDEAVRWQIKDLLPLRGNEEVVVDWKIVNESEREYEVLAIVIQKNILSGYVDACGLAGLYPVTVETPSLSLTRINSKDEEGKLIIYSHLGSSIIILTTGEKISGSSIVPSLDQAGIILTASQIVNHFKSIPIKKIKIGGLEFNRDFLKQLQRNFNVPVEWMTVSINGFSAGQIQEYLIPLSLQLNEPLAPENEQSINLLPPDWVQKYQDKKFNVQVWSLTTISTTIISFCFLASVVFYLFLLSQAQSLPKGESDLGIPKDFSREVDNINLLSDKVVKIKSASELPQSIVNEVSKLQTPGIHILTYQLDLDTGRVMLKGTAQNRQVLIDFKKALEKSENLDSISIPLSSLEKEDNLEFEINFYYSKLKGKTTVVPILK